MKKLIKSSLLVSLMLLAAACNQPITQRPGATAQELETEQEYQRQQVEAAGEYKEEAIPATELAAYDQRLHKVAEPVITSGEQMCQQLQQTTRQSRCNFDLQLTKESGINASANGNSIMVTASMVRFANGDPELAFVVAHEMAHNIMGHVAAQQQNIQLSTLAGGAIDAFAKSRGIDTGGMLGQQAGQYVLMKYSPAYEQEADYVGLYILANAGYPIENVASFWRRMSTVNQKAIYTTTTHPTNPSRYVMMQKTVTEIQQKRASGQPLIPQIAPKK